jgi:hypothetical protein
MVAKTLFSRLQQQQLSSWILLLVGVLFGRSTVVFKLTKLQQDESTSIEVELLVLPLYMLLVLIYIGLRAFQVWKVYIQPSYMPVKSMKSVSHRSPLQVPQTSLLPIKLLDTPKNDQNVVDYIDKGNDDTSAAAAAAAAADDVSMNKIAPEAVYQPPINLTGVYKLISNTNYEEFLAAQGVSWALRRAANRVWEISIQPCMMHVKSMKPVSHRSHLPVPQTSSTILDTSAKNDQNVVDDVDKSNDDTSAAAAATADDDSMNKIVPSETVYQPINLTGVYKLISNTNYEEFLAAQGVSWALRRAANQARPIHRITHIGNTLTIQIQGIIESQTTYIINGPPVETNVRGRLFLDQAKYIDNGIQVFKTAVEEDYDVTVTRELSEDGQQIILTGCAIFRDENIPTVQTIQVFQRLE